MQPNNSQLNLQTDNTADFIFKKGNYTNTYIVVETTGLPNGVILNLLDANSKQLYSPYDTNGNKRTTQCYITVGQKDIIPLPANFNASLSTYSDFATGTYNWKLKFNGNDEYEEKTLPLTVEIRDFNVYDFITPSIYPDEPLKSQVRTYVDTTPVDFSSVNNIYKTAHATYANGIISYPSSDIDVSVGTHTFTLNQANNLVFNYEVKNPIDFYYNGVTAYDGIVNIGYLTHQLSLLPAHAQYNPNILINNKIISTNHHGTGGNAPNISVYNGYNAKTFPPGIYYCTVTSHTATNGKQYTCEGSFEISTDNCVINLSFSYENDDDILTSTYLYNTSVPISNALMGLVNAQTNALITTATTNSNGQIQWNVGDGVYKVMAINVDNEYILSSEPIDLISEYTLITDIALNDNNNIVVDSIPSISIKEPTDLVTNVALDDNGNIVVEKNTFNPGDNTENVISKIYIDANNRLIAETYNIYTNDIVLDSTKDIIQKNETTKLTATVLDKINQTTSPNKTVNFYSE